MNDRATPPDSVPASVAGSRGIKLLAPGEVVNFRCMLELVTGARDLASRLPRDIDAVVGIPRSGMIPAYAIGLSLDLPVWTLDQFLSDTSLSAGVTRKQDRLVSRPRMAERVLVVDDSVDTGAAMGRAVTAIRGVQPSRIHTCAIYVDLPSIGKVDYFHQMVERPRVFEWNLFNHNVLEHSCLDIDGVLCFDPPPEDNDDGERYLQFLASAQPRFVPKRKLKAIASARLEKYRPQTEAWLAANNIEYGKLYLLDGATAEERRRNHLHAKIKIFAYLDSGATCFIESDLGQAQQIANATDRAVICTDAMRLVRPGPSLTSTYSARITMRSLLRRFKRLVKS